MGQGSSNYAANTECPTRFRTRHLFNNSNSNEDIATKFEQEYVRCVRNEKECVCSASNCCDMEQRSASQPGSVASGTLCIRRHRTQFGRLGFVLFIIIGIQPLGRSGQRPEFSQATGIALVRCILGKFLGVACHCFPPLFFRCSHFSPPGASTSATT